jgi:hypothetical protein
MMNKQLVSLFAITLLQPILAMHNVEDLNAFLLGVRYDVVDPGYIMDLLTKGAQVDARDGSNATALMKFAKRSYYPECRLLITHSRFNQKHATAKSDTTLDTLLQYKLMQLKPLMAEAMALAKDKDLRTLLDPDRLEENLELIKEIRENIKE